MGDVVLSDSVELGCSAGDAFESLVSGGISRWRLPLGRELQVGVPITFPFRLPAHLGGQRAEILGRVRRVEYPFRLVIGHDLPWRGTVTITVRPRPGGSVVRLQASVADDFVSWAAQFVAPIQRPGRPGRTWRIGLISSGTGSASVFSMATGNMARLAVEEINADGGVLGRKLELMTGDDGTHPGMGAAELVRLAQSGCGVVLANVTSATFRALVPVARKYEVLLLHTPMNEGGTSDDQVFRLGERPHTQAVAGISAIMEETGARRFYLAGSQYSWPKAMLRTVRQVIERSGGSVAGERYVPFGSSSFCPVIESIATSDADAVVSTFVGADEVDFQQQMRQTPEVTSNVQVLSCALDESTHEFMGPAASEGLWTVFSYFEDLEDSKNSAFLGRYRDRFGLAAPPPSSLSECVYEAIHLVGRAAAKSGDTSPQAIGRQLRSGVAFDGPRGSVHTSWKGVHQPMYIARSSHGRLKTIDQVAM